MPATGTPTAGSARVGRWLARALRAHRAGALDEAGRLYRRVLAARPGHPDALHYLGVLAHQRGHGDEALALIGRALAADPRYVDAHNNLGNVHKESGRLEEAEACYRRTLAIAPHADAMSNLAVVLEAQGRLDEAFEAYGALLRHVPDHARGHYLLGLFLRNHAQDEAHARQSVECFRTAWRLDQGSLRVLEALGVGLYMLGRHDEAREVYADWLRREPDSPLARHMLAACGGSAPPPRAADDYVRELFDGFADSFDEQLLKNLDYRAPQLVADALAAHVPAAGAALEVLDAGCGTGLCGPFLRPLARRLTGVDLSPGMVEKARARGGYDTLVVDELTAFLVARPDTWDVIVSADTLVYFGELDAVAAAAFGALRPGGWLAFTVEALPADADRVELGVSGRYRHGRAHVRRALASAGFEVVRLDAAELRKEAGEAVSGWVVLARRAAAAR
ncbi:tetratricopeptide repeat protein [Coralloluteibacterium thermophilus]|uniref:Tetratricopeptide repeat protein n=1 Tax=Coralloluteibacterium thermophilum TaxID=2707049 RepID=A0ABV9NN11_9GAMM